MQGTSDLTVFIDLISIPLRKDVLVCKRSGLSCFDMEEDLENKKKKMDLYFTLV